MPETSENPWEDATIDQTWSRSALSNIGDPNEADQSQHPREEREDEIGAVLVRFLVNLCHLFDFLLGLLFTTYGVVLILEPKDPPAGIEWLCLGFGSVWLSRSIMGTYSVYRDSFQRRGLLIGAFLSALMALALFLASMITLGTRHKIAPYLQDHQTILLIPAQLIQFLHKHSHAIWITLLVGSLLECLRFITFGQYHHYLLEDDHLSLQLLEPPTGSRTNQARKPWWWRTRTNTTNRNLDDPLLENGQPAWTSALSRSYEIQDAVSVGVNNGGGFFSNLFKRPNITPDRTRDDSSVSFASVQEEWASRSEEDPLWWSKEDNTTAGSSPTRTS